jgi:hypothetical protein
MEITWTLARQAVDNSPSRRTYAQAKDVYKPRCMWINEETEIAPIGRIRPATSLGEASRGHPPEQLNRPDRQKVLPVLAQRVISGDPASVSAVRAFPGALGSSAFTRLASRQASRVSMAQPATWWPALNHSNQPAAAPGTPVARRALWC